MPGLARDIAATRDFFIIYKDRILYGADSTDMHTAEDSAYMDSVVDMVQRFLETSDDMELWGLRLKGACLPGDVQRAIYSENFLRLVPRRQMNEAAAARLARAALACGRRALSAGERQTTEALWG